MPRSGPKSEKELVLAELLGALNKMEMLVAGQAQREQNLTNAIVELSELLDSNPIRALIHKYSKTEITSADELERALKGGAN